MAARRRNRSENRAHLHRNIHSRAFAEGSTQHSWLIPSQSSTGFTNIIIASSRIVQFTHLAHASKAGK